MGFEVPQMSVSGKLASNYLPSARRLENNNIRHLIIRKGQDHDPIDTELEVGPIKDGELIVVSYCWDDSADRKQPQCTFFYGVSGGGKFSSPWLSGGAVLICLCEQG